MDKSILILLLSILFISCSHKKNNSKVFYASDNPIERALWEEKRLANPNTNKIPKNIRSKELIFSKTLPKSNLNSKSNWINRGLYNVGGRTRALSFDVLDENIILAGGASGGMFRSIDGGLSWNMTTGKNQEHRISCITQDKRVGKENIWYFGTGETRGSYLSDISIYGNGIFKSIDGGLTWDSLPVTTSNTPTVLDGDFDFTFSIKTDPSNDTLDVVYVATRGDIYRTEDGGTSWEKELGGPNNNYYQYTDVEVTSSGVVYATISSNCTDKGIWRSADGKNWTNITDSLFSPIYSRVEIGINPSNENEVYFIAAETTNYGQHTNIFFNRETWTSLWKYEYISGDGTGNGGVWTDLSTNIPANSIYSFDNFNAQGSYDLLVSVNPLDPNLVIIGGTNLWRSTDGFTSPNNTDIIGGYRSGSHEGDGNWGSYKNHHPDQHEIVYLPSNPNILINGNDGGVYKTLDVFKDTVEWISLNNGYNTTQLYTASVSKNPNSPIMYAGLQDNGCRVTGSIDSESEWKMPFNGDGMYAGIADNEEDFYMSIQRGVLYKMKLDNSGERLAFQRLDPASCDSTKYNWRNPFAFDKNSDNIIYWGEGNQLWRNNSLSSIPYNNSHQKNDLGWHAFSDSLNLGVKISMIKTSIEPPNIVYYGTESKYIFRVDDAHVGDPSHTMIYPPQEVPISSYCHDIAINSKNADEFILVYSNYNIYSLYHTKNSGISFTKIAGNLEQNNDGSGNGPSCRSAKIIHLGNDTLYLVGTSVGLYGTSSLKGENTVWEQIGYNDFGSTIIEDIIYRDSDKLLVVATYGNGIYQTNLNSISDILNIDEIKNQFSFNIFPNPVVNSLNIVFDSKRFTDIFIDVYDELGRKLICEKQKGSYGKKTFKLDVSELKSGIYFISCNINGEVETKQFVVRK